MISIAIERFVLFSVDLVRSNPRVVCRLDHGPNHPPRRPTRRLSNKDCLTTHSFKPPMPPPPRVWFCFCSWVGSFCFSCVPGVFSCGAWAESREADFGAKSAICYDPFYKHPPGPCICPTPLHSLLHSAFQHQILAGLQSPDEYDAPENKTRRHSFISNGFTSRAEMPPTGKSVHRNAEK